MHELSIAESLVTTAVEAIREQMGAGSEAMARGDIVEVHLRLGMLAGVEKDALLFCYDVVISETPLAGSRLVIEEWPVVIFCGSCRVEVALPDLQCFCCPRCGQPSRDIRQGRELELVSIHFGDRLADPTE